MTSIDRQLDWANEFDVPPIAKWLERAKLPDRFEDKAIRRPILGMPEDTEGLPFGDALVAALSPRTWSSCEQITDPTPARANEHVLQAVEGGIDAVELLLDQPGRDGYEPTSSFDFEEADEDDHIDEYAFDESLLDLDLDTEIGSCGVAIHHVDDLAEVLDGVDLRRVPVSIAAHQSAMAALAMLVAVASERGVAPNELDSALAHDPLRALFTRRACTLEDRIEASEVTIGSVFRDAGHLIDFCGREAPGIRPLAVDARPFHHAGLRQAIEVAYTIAAAVEQARQLERVGVPFERFAGSVVFRVETGLDMCTEIAKLRALRLLWAKVARACGTDDHYAAISAETSRRSRATEFDLRTNMVRSTVAAFAAIAGGCDRITITPFDAHPLFQTRECLAAARSQHHVLRAEGRLGEVTDPTAGSYVVDYLTRSIAAEAWEMFQQVESSGGMLTAMRSGEVSQRLQQWSESRQIAFATGTRKLVGITRYVDPDLEGKREEQYDIEQIGAELNQRRISIRERQVEVGVVKSIRALQSADSKVVESCVDAARQGASLWEITMARWPRDAREFTHRHWVVGPADGAAFEDPRAEIAIDSDPDHPPAALLLMLGDSREVAANADFARDLLRSCGLAVVEDTLESIDELVASLAHITPGAAVVAAAPDDQPQLLHAIARSKAIDASGFLGFVGPYDPEFDDHIDAFIEEGEDVVVALEEMFDKLRMRLL